MEKAVLKTLIYSDIFDYPLRVYEIHKWLIGRQAPLRRVETVLKHLSENRKAKSEKRYYSLSRKEGLAAKRIKRANQSLVYIRKVRIIAHILKIIPWIKLVGISGGLAMENADRKDDIDLFLVTTKNRLWLSRFLTLCILSFLGQRRKVNQKNVAGKICCNILVDENNLEQKRKDIYTAHEVLQMKVLWQRDGIYGKYLEENSWAFKYLPNWVGTARGPASSVSRRASSTRFTRSGYAPGPSSLSPLASFLEAISKKLQLKIMQKPKGMERIEEGALYFHPNDVREKILNEYQKRFKRFSNT